MKTPAFFLTTRTETETFAEFRNLPNVINDTIRYKAHETGNELEHIKNMMYFFNSCFMQD